jgi:hypothetical protein
MTLSYPIVSVASFRHTLNKPLMNWLVGNKGKTIQFSVTGDVVDRVRRQMGDKWA